jgi:hypothetical protein
MTHNEQKAQDLFQEWGKAAPPYLPDEMIEFAAFCLDKNDILPEAEEKKWASLNHRLLANFLYLPEEHQIHLMESMLAKRPKLIETLNASKGDDK